MTQFSFRPRLPRSWQMSACEARNAALPLLALAALAAAGRLPALGWGPGVLLALALVVAALVRPRRAALVMGAGVLLVGLAVVLSAPAGAALGLLLAFFAPLAARR
ncbi:hypothetical protein QOL99_07265 [Deinococcus sp. MIMF12]|uniref:Uncharacterized protein n=1 Tax=Deinococcus rhizophilus TaxID=3049544 RepID=A0ABT7JFW0_9DEIO|nr:hypothetical protein [Deinococcus rhizophilus]MDL2343948.1 hypothetical protein [Deinococcus rhizophilus]